MPRRIRPPSGLHIIIHTLAELEKRSQVQGVRRPYVVGLSGPQGSGKSTIAKFVADGLRAKNVAVAEFSIDDVYYGYQKLQEVRATGNTLLQRRGLPGTHDVDLCVRILDDLLARKPVDLPVYDKSAHSGLGDRSSTPRHVEPPYDVIIFEGWCVGFPPLPDDDVVERWNRSRGLLANHSLEHVLKVNDSLYDYQRIWDKFDTLIQIEAQHLDYVYKWRLQQEHALIADRGTGMTDDQVREFVDGYMPAYELYLDGLRTTANLHLTLDIDRKVVSKRQNGRL